MLSLYEQVVLLAFRDEKGTPESGSPEIAIAAGLVADLVERGRVDIADDKQALVSVVDGTPTGDALLDDLLNQIATARRARSMASWIERTSQMRKFRERVTASLVDKGILEAREHKVLRVFPTTRYPEADPQPEAELVERLRHAVFSDVDVTEIDERTCLLVGIADATKLLPATFGRSEVQSRRQRIALLSNDQRIGEHTRRAVRAAEATMATIAIVSATTASAANS